MYFTFQYFFAAACSMLGILYYFYSNLQSIIKSENSTIMFITINVFFLILT